jgi:hypothetical protein
MMTPIQSINYIWTDIAMKGDNQKGKLQMMNRGKGTATNDKPQRKENVTNKQYNDQQR